MDQKIERLHTFLGKWSKSHVVKPEDLAENGFYYTGDRDKVACVYCRVKLLNWRAGDNPCTEHFKYSPNCVLSRNIGLQTKTGDMIASTKNRHSEESPNISRFALSVIRQLGYDEDLIATALLRLERQCTSAKEIGSQELLETIFKLQDELSVGNCQLGDSEFIKIKKENTRLKALCKYCHRKPANMLLLPCRHLSACESCKPRLSQCPICHALIRCCVQTYM